MVLNCCLKLNICGSSENTSWQKLCLTSLLTDYVRKNHFEETQDRRWRWAPLFQLMLRHLNGNLLPMAQCMLISPHITAICQPLLVYPPPHPPGPQVNSLLIGGRQTATMATSCLANPLLEDVEEEDGLACGCLVQTSTQTVCAERNKIHRVWASTRDLHRHGYFFSKPNPCSQIIRSSSASAPVFVDVWSPFCQKAVQVGGKVRGQRPELPLTVLTCARWKPPRTACNWFLREMDRMTGGRLSENLQEFREKTQKGADRFYSISNKIISCRAGWMDSGDNVPRWF